MRPVERSVQLIEVGLAGGERFGIADELEARIDGIPNDVAEVVEIQGCNVFGAVLQPQRAEGPVERIGAVLGLAMLAVAMLLSVQVAAERGEAWAFRQVASRGDPMC